MLKRGKQFIANIAAKFRVQQPLVKVSENGLAGMAGVILVMVIGTLLIWLPRHQVRGHGLSAKDALELENAMRATFAQCLGGLFLFVTGYFALKNSRISERTIYLSEESHKDERFAKAIEQLGNRDNLQVRLAAIYSLEQIARDSEKYHWPVIEVLVSFVRQEAPTEKTYQDNKVPLDIQTTITVLGRRRSEREDEKLRLDLSDLNLAGVKIAQSNFSHVDFRRSCLDSARIEESAFSSAYLSEASLRDVWITNNSSFENAHMFGATMENVIVMNVSFQGAELMSARLSGGFSDSIFNEAQMGGIILVGATFIKCKFRDMKWLHKDRLSKANLEECEFTDPELLKVQTEQH